MLMDLSALFKKKQNTDKESYFGLFLRGESAVGFIFEIVDNTVSLIAKEKIKYKNGWEEIVDDVDELLAILESETQLHVTQCIFFIYSYFIDEETGDIKEQYKNVMKQLSKELDLKPLGFIEAHEAVKDMLEKEEATPLNSVMTEVDSSHVSLYVYKGGKLIHKDQSARTDSIVADITEIVEKRKEQYLLPSKMVLYGSNTLEEEAKEIKNHNWKEDAFIQAPRITVLSNEDVLRSLGNTFMEQIKTELKDVEVQEEEIDLKEDVVQDKEVKVSKAEKEIEAKDAFVEEPEPKHETAVPKRKPVVPDDGIPDEADKVGFVVGEDITETEIDEGAAPIRSFNVDTSFAKNIKLPSIKFPKGKIPKKPVFVGITVLLLLATAAVAEVIFHKAELQVIVPANKISDEISLEGDVGGEVAGAFSIITSTSSAEVKDEVATTGQREVGEKAKGTVILNNFEDRAVTYSAGTKITVDSLTYTLDSDVTIASASSSVTTIQAQTKEAGVTADTIGTEYNIDKEKRMTVAGAPSRNIAVSKSAFSGGSKKQLKTVAKKDLEQLDKRVLDKAKKLSASAKNAEAPSGMQALPALTEVHIAEAKYSGEVGQEAEKVSVNATVSITSYLVDNSLLKKEIATRLEPDVPSGYKLDTENMEYKVGTASKKNGSVNVDVLGEASAVKVVDKNKIMIELPGKSIDEVKKVLRDKYEVEDVIVKTNSTPILPLSNLLPFQKNNITIDIRSN